MTLTTFYEAEEELMNTAIKDKFEEKMKLEGLKETLQADLKLKGLHREVLKLIRCFEIAKAEIALQNVPAWHLIEIQVLSHYLAWIEKQKE